MNKAELAKNALASVLHLAKVAIKISTGFYKADPTGAVTDLGDAISNVKNIRDAILGSPSTPEVISNPKPVEPVVKPTEEPTKPTKKPRKSKKPNTFTT